MNMLSIQDLGANRCFLRLEGDWPLDRAGELKDGLQRALDGYEEITIKTKDVNEVALTFFQLLISAYRTAQRDGKRLQMEGPFPGGVVRDAWLVGLLPRMSGRTPDKNVCALLEERGN